MKQKLGPKNVLYPQLATIVGVVRDGKPNFLAVSHIGSTPLSPHVVLGLDKDHYSNKAIKENKEFSINVPSEQFVKYVDYAGLVSGEKVDKSKLCKIFYGSLEKAPLIEACLINMECKLLETIEFEKDEFLIGEIVETHCYRELLNKMAINTPALKPLFFDMQTMYYYNLGGTVAKCWDIGKALLE
ncbi:MAG: flavin reductase family protein [Candidatus Thorarchaeota archaeon]